MTKPVSTYLGDGVYATSDKLGLLYLTVGAHNNSSSQIFLEPEVLLALLRFVQREEPKVFEALKEAFNES